MKLAERQRKLVAGAEGEEIGVYFACCGILYGQMNRAGRGQGGSRQENKEKNQRLPESPVELLGWQFHLAVIA